MAWKSLNQLSFADSLHKEHDAIKELDGVEALIDWSEIETLLSTVHNKVKGEKAWPPLMMFKALLLQSWYDLSDPKLEKQLARDLLFKRFVGLGLSEGVPDHSTLWHFRNLLESEGHYDELLACLNEQLKNKELIIRTGEVSIIDASVIEAKQCRPNKDKQGNTTQDQEAGYNVKKGSDGKNKATYGFKVHMNVEEDGFIKKHSMTAGNVHDSNEFETLFTGTERAAYADSAYKSKTHDELLKTRHIDNCITERAYRNKPLTKEQTRHNRIHSGTRSIVERVFGVLKLHYGMPKARYLGIDRNRARIGVMGFAHNLKRGFNIQQACG